MGSIISVQRPASRGEILLAMWEVGYSKKGSSLKTQPPFRPLSIPVSDCWPQWHLNPTLQFLTTERTAVLLARPQDKNLRAYGTACFYYCPSLTMKSWLNLTTFFNPLFQRVMFHTIWVLSTLRETVSPWPGRW